MSSNNPPQTQGNIDPANFQQLLLSWFDQHGRKDLPWQHPITPYRVWLSETMLQQTQVSTVIPYFLAFTERFPTISTLAQAPVDEVLHLWSGLGYYARARNLHKSAQLIVAKGEFPNTLADLLELPGIGRSTAGAILSIAFGQSTPILDGNVKRVLARLMAIPGWPGNSKVAKQLWEASTRLTPITRAADYTQAIMDLGATVCTRRNADCPICPLATICIARLTDTVNVYPASKTTKQLPIKHCLLLVITNIDGEILLEKRPPTGIWGGLWSLPECSSVEMMHEWCVKQNLTITHYQTGNQQRHTFSHYQLDFTPVFIDTMPTQPHVIAETGCLSWFATQKIEVGLPTPIKKLLTGFIKPKGELIHD
jgi:A/G-specific adenine glycosylase